MTYTKSNWKLYINILMIIGKWNGTQTGLIKFLPEFILTSNTELRLCAELVVDFRGLGTSSFLTVRVIFVRVDMVLQTKLTLGIFYYCRIIFIYCLFTNTEKSRKMIVTFLFGVYE